MQPQSSQSNIIKINEVFYSVQGEGKYVGTAAVFVRLSGCTMGCAWCDTKYAQKVNFELSPSEILELIQQYPAKTVIITGGEPTEQNIAPLLKILNENGFEIHLETNGAHDIDTSLIYCVTVSPKKHPLESMLKKADVIKLVVDGNLSDKEILEYKKYANAKTTLYLQPEGNKQENTRLCLKIIQENPSIKLSLQLHKLINIT